MENYNKYTKDELVEMLEWLDRPINKLDNVCTILCELLSCENCPVTLFDFDKRTEEDRVLRHAPCCGELHKWLLHEFNKKIVEEIINTIYEEIENSGDSYYVTKENQEFSADVGYVKEWLDDYKEVLCKRYS